ncbi:YqfQ family protein [Desertibacillus haloalkaliphilus]|uniref:YqfQ family protein n=1 Tax=Desertibacillus haloalkaliphilus TaxID=1328930 RepID=UPI001C26BF28|nr:YqfQ family protein [Desertibacillus haloalkaliphilus]MBU8905687.1 YqfQ family protein [Desertibacillus haloalkaliphilus]
MFPRSQSQMPMNHPPSSSYGMPQHPFQGYQGMPMQQVPPRPGGLLSRLFGGRSNPSSNQAMFPGSPQQPQQPFGFPGMMGGAEQIPGALGTNPVNTGTGLGMDNILNFLQNTQKAIGMAQSVGPMIQQYGPLVKSMPALLGMFAGGSDSSNPDEDDSSDSTEEEVIDVEVNEDSTEPSTQDEEENPAPSSQPSTATEEPTSTSIKDLEGTKGTKEGITPAPKLYI